MFSKSYAFILCLLVLSDHILEGVAQEEGVEARRPAKKGDINFDLGQYGMVNRGRFPGGGGPIANIIGTGNSITVKKGRMSGLAKALDDRLITIDRFGSPFGGMPEDMLGHIRFCAEFVYNGLFSLVFLTIRYPLKILSKAVLYTGAIGHILTYANWCINPLSLLEFTENGKRVNAHLERLAQFREELKIRMMWVTDKAQHSDKQMYTCCSLHEYTRKIYDEVPEAVYFAKLYHVGLYKLPILIYCWKYQFGSKACANVDLSPADEEPDRVIPQSYVTNAFEILDTFL